jgi:hypothetical protein
MNVSRFFEFTRGGDLVKLKMDLKAGLRAGLLLLVVGLTSSTLDNTLLAAKLADRGTDAGAKPCNFFPPNKLRFPIRNAGQMPEHTFRRIVQVVGEVYAPLFRQAGHPPLYISPRWEDDEVNAFALDCSKPDMIGKPGYPVECGRMRTSLNVYTPFSLVVMFGGLARHPLMTSEGFILVACHEIGHHLGGFPRYQGDSWASTEGQADYFSTAKCARKVLAAMGDNQTWLKTATVEFGVRQACNASFSGSPEEAAICMRSAMGGLALAHVLGSLSSNDIGKIDFANRDRNIVTVSEEGHPAAQCRLDTYFAGAVCRISADQPFGLNDSRTGACHPSRMENFGARPACWFAETKH